MKFLAGMAVGLACLKGAAAEEDWKMPDWKAIGELSRAEDKALSDEALGGSCAEGPECDGRRAALVASGSRRDFLLIESASIESCGDHNFYVYGPGRRVEPPEFSYCADALKYRARGGKSDVPDFLVSGVRVGSAIGGASGWVFEDVLLKYEKGRWTETVIMAIDYEDGKPKVPGKN